MGKFLRLCLAFGIAATALFGVSAARPSWAASLGVDWWTLAELEKVLQEQLRQQEELDWRTERTRERTEGQTRVIADVAAGRITLVEAAVQFRTLSRMPSRSGPSYRDVHPGNSDGERLCRYVISWTKTTLSDCTLAKSVVESLEAELRRLLQEDGIVHLPKE